MKRYSIVISDPVVQQWFNMLYDEAQLSKTIEGFALAHMEQTRKDFLKLINQRDNPQTCVYSRKEKKGFFGKMFKK
jgi:hypothetical protein